MNISNLKSAVPCDTGNAVTHWKALTIACLKLDYKVLCSTFWVYLQRLLLNFILTFMLKTIKECNGVHQFNVVTNLITFAFFAHLPLWRKIPDLPR